MMIDPMVLVYKEYYEYTMVKAQMVPSKKKII